MSLIGIHVKSDFESIIKNNIKFVQLFVSNFKKNKINDIKQLLEKHKIICCIHASYTINLSRNWDNRSYWIHQFINEIYIADNLNAKFIVVHLGMQLKLSLEESLNNLYSSLLYILSKTNHLSVQILLETSSGQGSEILYDINNFAKFFNKFNKLKKYKLGICIDTCHIYVAGYDIIDYLREFDKLIGLQHVKLVHLNNSKNIKGSKIDRHDNYNENYFKIDKIFSFFNSLEIPIIIETPTINIIDDYNYLKKIK